jgi:hypothetical protein
MEAAVAAGIPLRPVAGGDIPLHPAAEAIAHPLLPTAVVAAEVRTAGVNRRLKKSIFVSSSVKESEVRRQKSGDRRRGSRCRVTGKRTRGLGEAQPAAAKSLTAAVGS